MMADPSYQFPHRKPLPHLQPDGSYPSSPTSASFSHSRSRTSSSSVFPQNAGGGPQMLYASQNAHTTRRTPSTGTFSTTASSGNGPVPNRQSASSDLRRSTSSRSTSLQQPNSYVALMRKQKATVWCDRAQHEDPRLLAAQRAAKVRAIMEVSGGAHTAGRVSTGGAGSLASGNRVTAKIRHHGKAGLVGYNPSENFGVGVGGVPMRLSASEVEGGDSDDEMDASGAAYHQRSGSGRSSLGSVRQGLSYARPNDTSVKSDRRSSGHTPPSENEQLDSLTDLVEETPVPAGHLQAKDYFSAERVGSGDGNASAGSGSSGEKADAVGELGGGSKAAQLASNKLLKSAMTREKSTKNPDELRRRGSVDERTMTMTMNAGRLYIANPDADSD